MARDAYLSADPMDLDRLVRDPATGIIVCCGSGGVGKTTTAAAIGVHAAELGRSVVVLTIDPRGAWPSRSGSASSTTHRVPSSVSMPRAAARSTR